MATQTVTVTSSPAVAIGTLSIDTAVRYGDWRDDLFDHGFAVVKQVIHPDKAQYYVNRMFSWLESFPLGFDRNDQTTWKTEHLPYHWKGGMYHYYSVQHEDFVWEARTEPGVLEAFSKLWGTDELLVSFDGINFTLPEKPRPENEPWPHIDQSPRRHGLVCAQGIINFAPNGPDDGGLVVVKGSHRLIERFFRERPELIGRPTWGPEDWFGFTPEETSWFKEQGCEVTKVCADPGDLIIWDSRTIHYNKLPDSDQIRSIVYACYGPASETTSADLQTKREAFSKRRGTTHWPNMQVYFADSPADRVGEALPGKRDKPISGVKETPQILKLAGVAPY